MAFHRQAATGCNLGVATAVLGAVGQWAVEIGMVQGGEDIGSSVTIQQAGTIMDMEGGGEMGDDDPVQRICPCQKIYFLWDQVGECSLTLTASFSRKGISIGGWKIMFPACMINLKD